MNIKNITLEDIICRLKYFLNNMDTKFDIDSRYRLLNSIIHLLESYQDEHKPKVLKLYEVTNGFIANDYIHILCICESKTEAIKQATIKLKKEKFYRNDYYNNLTVTCLCEDISNGYTSEIRGG